MNRLPQLGSLALVLLGLVTARACFASGKALPVAGPDFLLTSGQGYLGVELGELDADRAQKLHLADTHGAEVTMIDHDAPAGKSGLKVHDVILQLDGQPVESAELLRHRLREMPAGQTLSLTVSRDGNERNLSVQLCDRAMLQHQAWLKHFSVADPTPAAMKSPGKSFLEHAPSVGPQFLVNVLPKTLYVGADVNPVHTQLADYFGVTSGTGLLVVNVDAQSPAAHAGMKAGDVIIKVESQSMISRGDWLKALHKHRGQPVQVTVMRNKQEQVLTMTAGKPKKG